MATELDDNQVDDRLLQDEEDSEHLVDGIEGNGAATEEDSAILDGEVEGDEGELSGAGGEEGSLAEADESGDVENDPEVLALKAQLKAMEQEGEKEAERLRQMETEAQLNMSGSNAVAAGPTFLSPEEKKEIDARSIYVGNVDYGATAEELEQHFHGCGSINRVTINCDKFSGHPKGFAYIEFAETDGVDAAQALDESLFRGRQIKVVAKRTNVPGHSTTNRGIRGRGGFRGRPGFRGYNPYRARPRGGYRGGFRGRGRYVNYYSPY